MTMVLAWPLVPARASSSGAARDCAALVLARRRAQLVGPFPVKAVGSLRNAAPGTDQCLQWYTTVKDPSRP